MKNEVKLKPMHADSEAQAGEIPNPQAPEKRLGYALVGLGKLTLEELVPAFASCKHSKLVALVSGDEQKAQTIAKQYGLGENSVYNYDNFDTIADNSEIDIVYIVLPNSMHAEFTIRAAKAGKHVLCEKPMATSAAEAQQMIDACREANRKLMIAYRIQYEPLNRLAMEWVREKKFGEVKLIDSVNTQNLGDPDQWRLKKALGGGGAMPDIGIYCLNTIRFLLGEEPEAVMASVFSHPGDERFREVEEEVLFQLHFPSGVRANCSTSYAVHQSRNYRCYAEEGWFGLDPAFAYERLQMKGSHAKDGVETAVQPDMGETDQFAAEMDHMSLCVMNDKQPYTPGEEGLQDHRIIEAIYESARTGKRIELDRVERLDAFRGTSPEEFE